MWLAVGVGEGDTLSGFDRANENRSVGLKAACHEFLPGRLLDLGAVRPECGEPGALARALCTIVLFQRFAADSAADLTVTRLCGEKYHVASAVVLRDLIGEVDWRVLDHAENVQNCQYAGELDVIFTTLEA